jgi:hypothetical protein
MRRVPMQRISGRKLLLPRDLFQPAIGGDDDE